MREFMKQCNPWKEYGEEAKGIFIFKKVVAFVMIYMMAAVIIEGIVIITFAALGYDFLHGEMPVGQWVSLFPYYGFIGFASITVLYCHFVEKRSLRDMKLVLEGRAIVQFLFGIMGAIALLGSVFACLLLCHVFSYQEMRVVSGKTLVIWFVAFLIQGSAEEIMCRGYLFLSLTRKCSLFVAFICSSVAFILPHLGSFGGMPIGSKMIAIMNLLLISGIFAIAVWRKSTWVACGIHVGWNYMLHSILGLQVSGGTMGAGVFIFEVNSKNVLVTGGDYGIEASIIVTIILGIVLLYQSLYKRGYHNGI